MARLRVAVVGLMGSERQLISKALGQRVYHPEPGASWPDDVVAVVHGGREEQLAVLGLARPHLARVRVCNTALEVASLANGGSAHQYLVRPLRLERVAETVRRAQQTHALLQDHDLTSLVNDLGSLPSLPVTYQALCTELVREVSSMVDIARVLERDVAVATRILQVVNSAMYSLPRRVASLTQAAALLGIDAVRDLVLAIEVFGELGAGEPVPGVSLEEMQNRAYARATLARVLAPSGDADAAYTAGLLGDLGRMVLVARASEPYQAVLTLRGEGLSLDEAEALVFGVPSRELGAWLLALWGLPWHVVDAVRTSGPVADPAELPVAGVVHIADLFVEEAWHEVVHDEVLVLVTREMLSPWGLEARCQLARSLARSMVRGFLEPPLRSAPDVAA